MSDLAQAPFIIIGLFVTVGGCAAAFTFGVAVVCRLMKWSPVNINIQIERGGDDAR